MQSLKLLLGYPIVVADVVGDEALPSGKVGVFAGDADKVHTASQFFLFLMHFFECNSAWAAGGFPEVKQHGLSTLVFCESSENISRIRQIVWQGADARHSLFTHE